jgi:hypothetical protein
MRVNICSYFRLTKKIKSEFYGIRNLKNPYERNAANVVENEHFEAQ